CVSDNDCVLANYICPPTGYDFWCYHPYEIASNAEIDGLGHLVTDPAGRVYIADYFPGGTAIERLDPATGVKTVFPLHGVDIKSNPYNLPDPWEMRILPPALGGHVVVGEYDGGRVARLEGARVDDPACQQLTSPSPNINCATSLNGTCTNACLREPSLPN